MKRLFFPAMLACVLGLAQESGPASLKPQPRAKYEAYIHAAEALIQDQASSAAWLWAERSPARWRLARSGQVVVEPWSGAGESDIGGAIIHDWIGAVFIPGVKLDRVVAFLQDYAIQQNYYRPEVVKTRLLSHDGNAWKISYRLVQNKFVTVVFDVNQTVTWYPVSATRMYTLGSATRIAEVRDADMPSEHETKQGKDHGYLWRLNSYWRLEEKDGGVYVESRSVSLSRTPPFGLGWLFDPIISALPRESLTRQLAATRSAVHSRPE
jgi:hypothetical protein